MSFHSKLSNTIQQHKTNLCLGLDPDVERLPSHLPRTVEGIVAFNQAIIAATHDVVCAYKPNSAFYEAWGSAGWDALKATIDLIPKHVPVIVDAKRGDIGSTAQAYAQAIFDDLHADAVTLNPYLGSDSLEPFLQRADRGCFILCRTSNPSSGDLQSLPLADGTPLYQHVAQLAHERWNQHGNCGLVVGATYPEELQTIRELCPDLWFLVPGVGTQGADYAQTKAIAGEKTLINISRAILYADNSPNYAQTARTLVLRYTG